jgi:hypothetical protein
MTRRKVALFVSVIACNIAALLTSAHAPEVVEQVADEVVARPETKGAVSASVQPHALPRSAIHAPIGPAALTGVRPLAPRFNARPQGEWDGMLVDLNNRPSCSKSENCGLGQACKAGRCMPCASDNECAQGEACVLDHCMPREHVSCRARSDCDASSQCILNGYSLGVRGNAEMKSMCVSRLGGASNSPRVARQVPVDDRPLRDAKLFEAAIRAASQAK